MNLNEYQLEACHYLHYPSEYKSIYSMMGLIAEWGILASIVKTTIIPSFEFKDNSELIIQQLAKVMVYLQECTRVKGLFLEGVDGTDDIRLMEFYATKDLYNLVLLGAFPLGNLASKFDTNTGYDLGFDFRNLMAIISRIIFLLNTTFEEVLELSLSQLKK